MRYLVTGTAGFVGFHLANRLLQAGHEVLGIDGMTPYYDVRLKEARNRQLQECGRYRFLQHMLEDGAKLHAAVKQFAPECVVHLAAQAGVRHSLKNPRAYIDANVVGSFNLLEACRAHPPAHLLVASTSSVYGGSTDFPLAENGCSDYPLTLYAATKKSVEAMAHCYSHLWEIPTTAFRLFSVYGAWGRPDMALFRFVENMLAGRAIDVYNNGKVERDFTYVGDAVDALVRLCELPPSKPGDASTVPPDASSPVAPYRIVNIGGRQPVSLLQFIEEIEAATGCKSERNYMEMQPGDVPRTEASTELLESLVGYRPSTPISVGVRHFVDWYRKYYRI